MCVFGKVDSWTVFLSSVTKDMASMESWDDNNCPEVKKKNKNNSKLLFTNVPGYNTKPRA